MFSPPPVINKISICTTRCKELINFYSELGMSFHLIDSNKKNNCYNYINDEFTFEINEVKNESDATKNIMFKFLIDDINGYIEDIVYNGGQIIKDLWETQAHQHLLIKDPDNNLIELITSK